jgi:hypothetical protein
MPTAASRKRTSTFRLQFLNASRKVSLCKLRKPLLGSSRRRFSVVGKLAIFLGTLFLSAPVAWGQSAGKRVKTDLGKIPVALALEQAFVRNEVNQPLSVTVHLKDIHGAAVAAIKDEQVELHYGGQVLHGVIPTGAQSVTFQVTPRNRGVGRIEVTSSTLAGASELCLVADKNSPGTRPLILPSEDTASGSTKARHSNPRLGAKKVATVASAPPPPLPPAAPPPSAVQAGLKIFVNPETIEQEPESGEWKAEIAVALVGPNDEFADSDRDLQLQLVAQNGKLNPAQVAIKKGSSSTFGAPVTLSSSSPGTDTISVYSSLPKVQQTVTYQALQPSQLRLEATPSAVINDGKSPVRIVVLLEDATKTTVRSATAVQVTLTSSRGSLAPVQVTIPAGEYSAEASLTSQQTGTVNITADASNLQRGQISASFLFPWMMVCMGALGGMLGATVHNPKSAFSAKWWTVIVLGVICGVVLCVAALFGAIGALPKLDLPIQISQIPSTNELGALLLGFVGGFYGKKFWPKTGEKQARRAAHAAGKTS